MSENVQRGPQPSPSARHAFPGPPPPASLRCAGSSLLRAPPPTQAHLSRLLRPPSSGTTTRLGPGWAGRPARGPSPDQTSHPHARRTPHLHHHGDHHLAAAHRLLHHRRQLRHRLPARAPAPPRRRGRGPCFPASAGPDTAGCGLPLLPLLLQLPLHGRQRFPGVHACCGDGREGRLLQAPVPSARREQGAGCWVGRQGRASQLVWCDVNGQGACVGLHVNDVMPGRRGPPSSFTEEPLQAPVSRLPGHERNRVQASSICGLPRRARGHMRF